MSDFEPIPVKPGTREIGLTADDGSQVTLRARKGDGGTFVTPHNDREAAVLEAYRHSAPAAAKPKAAAKRSSSSKAKATPAPATVPAETTGPVEPAPTKSEG